MMRKHFHVVLLALVIVVTIATFAVTRHLGTQDPSGGCTSEWLCLSENQCQGIRRQDPGFREEAQGLFQSLQTQQQLLIEQIRDSNSPDESIRCQAELVVAAHHDLMRRVVQHLLVVRHFADPQQCLQLNGLCAHALSGQRPGGGHAQRQHRGGRGPHGPDGGQGCGKGPGRQHHCGRLAPALGLTEEQQAEIAQWDPTFVTEVAQLTENVRANHHRFSQFLADPNASDHLIRASLEQLIGVREQLEHRTVEYVLRLRPLLSVEQQERLIGLSQRGCRWRGGGGG